MFRWISHMFIFWSNVLFTQITAQWQHLEIVTDNKYLLLLTLQWRILLQNLVGAVLSKIPTGHNIHYCIVNN